MEFYIHFYPFLCHVVDMKICISSLRNDSAVKSGPSFTRSAF